MRRFTLHVRLTKRCNADCAYCSSYEAHDGGIMSPADFRRAIDFVADVWLPKALPGTHGGHVAVQYVGGEILLVPPRDLADCVHYARQRLGEVFDEVEDGVQSNLIGSSSRVGHLLRLFGRRIGTSLDGGSAQRTIQGSTQKYQTIYLARESDLARRGLLAPAILVVDQKGLPFVMPTLREAISQGRDLTLRAVFSGGQPVGAAPIDELLSVYGAAFDLWVSQARIRVEPFFQMYVGRMAGMTGDTALVTRFAGCPFQHDCAEASLDIEPNGDLFICLDTADSRQFRLGNALTGEVDWAAWVHLKGRSEHLPAACQQCDYLAACQGGCMSEAIAHTGHPHGQTGLCGLWKALFARMDAWTATHGVDHVRAWLMQVGAP